MRSTRCASGGSTKKVSCSSRAGWSGLKLRESKLYHSDSTSGPSATSQPMATNVSPTRSMRLVSGCRPPRRRRRPAAVTSTASSTRIRASRSSSSTVVRAATAWLTRPRAWPTSLPAADFCDLSREPICRLASASGERSPAWASRTSLSSSRSWAFPTAARAASTAAATAASSVGSTAPLGAVSGGSSDISWRLLRLGDGVVRARRPTVRGTWSTGKPGSARIAGVFQSMARAAGSAHRFSGTSTTRWYRSAARSGAEECRRCPAASVPG